MPRLCTSAHRSSVPLRALLLPCAFGLTALPLASQTHRVAPVEKVTRAVAVYEWTGDLAKPTASRLVPVSLFINGHFEDAGLYLARPVPLALDPGDLYSVEQAGEEKGTLSIEHARDFTPGRLLPDEEPVGAWYGFGRFAPLTAPKAAPALHASAHPSAIVSSADGSRPHFGSKSAEPAASSQDGSGGKDAAPAVPSKTEDTGRPTLGRRSSGTGDTDSTKDPTDSTGPAPTKTKDTDTERPSLRKRSAENTGKRSPPQAGVTGPDRPLNDDPDRPTIRHGKTPVQEEASELKALPADMHQVAAVSDPVRRDPHPFAREWDSPAERADVLSRFEILARAQVSAYLSQNNLTPGAVIPPPVIPAANAAPTPAGAPVPPSDVNAPTLRRTPGGVNTSSRSGASPASAPTASTSSAATTPTSRVASSRRPVRRTAAHAASKPTAPPPILLTAERITGYTLSYGGLPTFVYSAEVPVATGNSVYVTLLAQRLSSGDFQVALHSITDSTHLDRTPWMRPVDAVDPDASHRASLLFELRAQRTRQFALYRLLSAQAEQQFVSSPIP